MTACTVAGMRVLLALALLLGCSGVWGGSGASGAVPAAAAQVTPAMSAVPDLRAAPLRAAPVRGGLRAAGCPGPDQWCEAASDTAGRLVDGVGDGARALDGTSTAVKEATGLDVLGGLPGVPGTGIPGVPDGPGVVVADVPELLAGGFAGVGEIANPMRTLGEAVARAAADAWTAAMLAIWSSGLFILRIVLTFSELFLLPDLRGDGPGRDVYGFTLWMAGALVVILTLVQLATTAFKGEAKGLGRALLGAGQFVVVCACWFGYCTLVVTACGGLTRALMKALLKVNTWPEWEPLGGLEAETITDATVATVLAFLGIFLWLAAIGHIVVYLARAASLLVLTATGPLAASGLVSESTRSWFWKSLRWFHAAAFTPVLMVMVLGVGVQLATGVTAHLSDGAQKSIGTALPAVMLILVSVVAPMALFKLLAFVDPGTPSGASFRQGMGAIGGVQGLLSGGSSLSGGGSSAATASDANGRSGGEASAESSTGSRFRESTQGLVGSLGPVGAGLAASMGAVTSLGAKAAGLLSDETNQAGVGQNTYGPDFSTMRSNQTGENATSPSGDHDDDLDGHGGSGGTFLPPAYALAGGPPPPDGSGQPGRPGHSGGPDTTPTSPVGTSGTAAGGAVTSAAQTGVPPVP